MSTSSAQFRAAYRAAKTLMPSALAGWSLAILAGSIAGLVAHKGGYPEMIAAQFSMGATGLVAGYATVRMARLNGGNPTALQGLLIAVIQAAVLIAGVTPLFAAIGFTLKLALLAFYSFSFAGAIGGLAHFFVFRRIFQDQPALSPTALFTIGYFSFGLAAGSASAVDLLSGYLPRAFLVPFTLGLIVSVTSIGSAAAMAIFLTGQTCVKAHPPASTAAETTAGKSRRRFLCLAFICIALPFYLNDFANIFISSWSPWLAIDYLFAKAYPLLGIAYLVKTKRVTWPQVGLLGQKSIPFVTVFLMGTLSVLFVLENAGLVTRFVSGHTALGRIPTITNPFWFTFDLYAGLFMVAVVEELIFRGFFCLVLEKYTQNTFLIVIISALAFGLIHWSAGFTDVTAAFLAGLIYMALYIQTRSLPAIVLSHFVVDLVSFSGLIPTGLLVFI